MPTTHLEARQLAAIVNQCFPQIEVQDYTMITGGYDSVVLIVNRAYIFRFPRREGVAKQLKREHRLLPQLAKSLPIPVPNFEFVWNEPQPYGLPFVGYRLLPGESMLLDSLSADQQTDAASQLATFLTTLHRFPTAQADELLGDTYNTASWRQSLRHLYADVQEKVLPLLSPDLQQATISLWQSFLDDDNNWRFTTRLIHADLGLGNILYDTANAKITGIIDWGDCEVGDPAMDFAGFLYDYGPPFTNQVLNAYQGEVDPTLRLRTQFYADIICYRETLSGIYTGDANHVQEGLGEIEQMLAARSGFGVWGFADLTHPH